MRAGELLTWEVSRWPGHPAHREHRG